MSLPIHINEELDQFLTYFPRNDTYTIRDINGDYFCVDDEPEAYRRWGQSHIYVGYRGTSIIRMEPHIIPCEQDIVHYCQSAFCPSFDRMAVNRLVAECWLDDFRPDSAICRKNPSANHRNAANNLYMSTSHQANGSQPRDPMQYEQLVGSVELV